MATQPLNNPRISVINSEISTKSANTPVRVELTSDEYKSSLFYLHRCIEKQYRDLPWPSHLRNITVYTDVQGGKGDLSAAAKVINVMQSLCSELCIDWVIESTELEEAQLFLKCLNDPHSKVKLRISNFSEPDTDTPSADYVIVGPVQYSNSKKTTEKRINRRISGPIFSFIENAMPLGEYTLFDLAQIPTESIPKEDLSSLYHKIHNDLFFTEYIYCGRGIPMGLQKGTGVLLDPNRIAAPLSFSSYCCPSYLFQIQDIKLKQDILHAFGIDDNKIPDYTTYSMNAGYAHKFESWKRFIDLVAIHEKKKNLIIVLNQKGEFTRIPTTQNFWSSVFTEEHLSFLHSLGYNKIKLKGADKDFNSICSGSRSITVIVRSSFSPDDMKCLQLSSERLLATGDNTAAEAWASKCILYLYEVVGDKNLFLEQQVAVANEIYPPLGEFIQLTGISRSLFPKEMRKVTKILENDPYLPQATLDFCNHITKYYSFTPVLEGALKRTAWHTTIPHLMQMEEDTMDPEFKEAIIQFLKSESTPLHSIEIQALPEIAKRAAAMVKKFL